MPKSIHISEQRYIERAWLEGKITAEALHAETSPQAVDRPAAIPNPFTEDEVGEYLQPEQRRMVTADEDAVRAFAERNLFPGFLAAGPREYLRLDPCTVRAAIVAVGGTAPGTNAVIHAIVRRHREYAGACQVAWEREGGKGRKPKWNGNILGIRHGFEGLMVPRARRDGAVSGPVELTPEETIAWRDLGGCHLGLSRYSFAGPGRIEQVAQNVVEEKIDILYIIGGDGGMHAALQMRHALSGDPRGANVVVAAIPKTMDNDIPWMWHALGHRTALAEAVRLLNALRTDAEANRRVILVELFGADAGFVASTAALASGKVDCVLIPEQDFDPWKVVGFIAERARSRHSALAVLAEGALLALGRSLVNDKIIKPAKPSAATLRDPYYDRADLRDQALKWMRDELRAQFIKPPVFTGHVITNQPGYLIRAVPPGAEDLVYAERLGDLVVDSALAGYTDFMLSQWLTGYVLVPLPLVVAVKRRIARGGIFWREVVSSTGQPEFS
jgi:6-phosphofructokinase 1